MLSATSNYIGNSVVKDQSTSSIVFSPRLGYYFTDRFALGLNINLLSSIYENKLQVNNYKSTSRGFGLGMFGRYLLVNSEKFAVFADLSLSVNSVYNEVTITTPSGNSNVTKDTQTQATLRMGPSIIFFPAVNWGIEGSIGVVALTAYSSKPDKGDEVQGSEFQFGVNSGLNLGVHYYFRGQ